MLKLPPMHVNLGIWDTLRRLVIFLLFITGLLALFFWYLPLIKQNERYRKYILALDANIAEEKRLARYFNTQIESVQYDSRKLERLAREKLGWARTNETVIRFEQRPR